MNKRSKQEYESVEAFARQREAIDPSKPISIPEISRFQKLSERLFAQPVDHPHIIGREVVSYARIIERPQFYNWAEEPGFPNDQDEVDCPPIAKQNRVDESAVIYAADRFAVRSSMF